jgi:Ni/Fe-hydrogenase subunit HybB-like protein
MSTTIDEREQRLEETVLRPLQGTSRAWYAWLGLLLLLIGVGFVGYGFQLTRGLQVTGLNDSVPWAMYIANFIFWSGVSMAGTFISAILRITGAEWRRPLTRFAELTTVSALMMCALMPLVDLGRPDRILNIFLYGRLESPLVWDIMVIPTYLTASIIYLFLFIIPDAAHLRDRPAGTISPVRRRVYTVLSLGWRGFGEQHRRLEVAAAIMMVLIIPIGLATHSVVSWIFAMSYRPGWDSTIFAPYFAVGALYSGVAMLITLMFIFRNVLGFKEYFTEVHFRYMGFMLAAFGLLYLYFSVAEYLGFMYKLPVEEALLMESLLFGEYSFLVWGGFIAGQIVPIIVVLLPWTRTIPILFAASLLVNVGMWIKRFIIVVPSMALPLSGHEWGIYTPTWVELAVVAASFAGFALVFTLFAKLFPLISIWEMREGWHGPEVAAAPEKEARPALEPAPSGAVVATSTGRQS